MPCLIRQGMRYLHSSNSKREKVECAKSKKNEKLWEVFDKEYSRVSSLCPNITWKHVKGHQNDSSEFTRCNNYVDKLAVRASRV